MTAAAIALDAAWLRAHPLPGHDGGTDKNGRGRVLAVGGSALCPGGLRLTGEAALRAGAGKLQMGTIAAAAMALGVAVPEAAVIALPAGEDGELAEAAAPAILAALDRADCLVLGPGMGDRRPPLRSSNNCSARRTRRGRRCWTPPPSPVPESTPR